MSEKVLSKELVLESKARGWPCGGICDSHEALRAERDALEAGVRMLGAERDAMKAERDAALAQLNQVHEELGGSDTHLTLELAIMLRAEVERMRPLREVVGSVCAAHTDCACSLCEAYRASAQKEG